MAALAAVQSATKSDIFPGSIGELRRCFSDVDTGINRNVRDCRGCFLHILNDVKHKMLKFIAVQHLVDSRMLET